MAIEYYIKIDDQDISKLTKFSVGRNKLWTDSGRNMAGELKSTFIGLFPKITLEFSYLTTDEVSIIAGLLDQPSFTVSWFDVVSKSHKSADYYASDFDVPAFDKDRQLWEPFSVNLVPFKKLT